MSLSVQNITPVIGAEVSGVNLAQIDDVAAAALRRLLADRGVLVFRNQELDHEAHKRAAACFGTGELHCHPLAAISGSADPAVLTVKATAKSAFVAGDGWHTDVSCDPAPIRASLLYMHEAPENGGGDTVFASMTEAYGLLSEPIRELIGNLRAVHDGAVRGGKAMARSRLRGPNTTALPIRWSSPIPTTENRCCGSIAASPHTSKASAAWKAGICWRCCSITSRQRPGCNAGCGGISTPW